MSDSIVEKVRRYNLWNHSEYRAGWRRKTNPDTGRVTGNAGGYVYDGLYRQFPDTKSWRCDGDTARIS